MAAKKKKAPVKAGPKPGRNAKGQCIGAAANPNGRPKKSKEQREFEQLCKEHSQEAFDQLLSIIKAKRHTLLKMQGIKLLLAYAYGKPKTSTDITSGGRAIPDKIRVIIERDA